jgi:hypothetical protein
MSEDQPQIYDYAFLKKVHAYSSNHKEAVNLSGACVCFYCEERIPTASIIEWTDSGDSTAICPRCGVDALIPEKLIEVTPQLLVAMRYFYFDKKAEPLTKEDMKKMDAPFPPDPEIN